MRFSFGPTPPLFVALTSHITASVVVFPAAAFLADSFRLFVPLILVLAVEGALAAMLGAMFGLARWWAVFNFLLPPLLVALHSLGLPSWTYFIVFALLVALYWNAPRDRVPLYLTNRSTVAALAGLLQGRRRFSFADLGCGLGGPLIGLARRFPEAQFVGVESAPIPFALARIRVFLASAPNVRIKFTSLWDEDLSAFDAVYVFLSPQPMPDLYEKAAAELRAGTLLISNSFGVPFHPADEEIEVDDRRRTRLFLWRF